MPTIGVTSQRLSSHGVANGGVASQAGAETPAEASGQVKVKLVDVETFCDVNGLGMMILDPALRIQKFSAAAASQFGLLPQDIGRDFRTFAGGIDSGDVVDRMMRCVGTGEADEFEIRQDRRGSWHLARVVPLGDLAGGQAGVMLTLIDLGSIEGRRREEQRLSSIVRWSTDAIIGRDVENRIVAWNPAAEQLYGYAAEEVLGTKADMIIPETESDGLQSSLKAFRRDQRVERFDSSRKTKGGDVLRVSVRMSPIRDEEHRVIGVSTIERDVADVLTGKGPRSERSNDEANSREDLENEFRQAIRQRDQFLAMLSHELRNPLGAILNTCAVLGKRKLMAKSVQVPISVVARQARQMAELLDDLLDVSRITTGKIKLEKGPVTLASIADEAIESQQALASTRGQRLTVTYCDEPLQVFGDRSRLVQVVVNLLNNAIKYTAEGGRITVILERRGRHGVIRVRDTGVGLEPDQIESLFEMFAQKDSTLDRSGGGMGLGLHLVRKLVSFHTGTVRGFSEGIGKGSEFVVELPLSTRKTPESREPSGTASASRKPKVKRIVVVEDIDDARNMLVALLESDGYQVTAAANGETGLALILKERPDLAIVDIGLPKLDGYEVARRVREVVPASDLRLVALTGYGQDSDHARVLEAGFDAHLVKPLNHSRLEMILAGG
jgi:two-component system CheB/CheR fusion protein